MNSEKTAIKDLIERDGRFVGVTSGFSMRPMIKSGRDVVVIEKKKDRLNPLDVALYIRGDSLILHRVLSVTNDGYIMRGDNCYKDEVVKEECVIGVLTQYFKNEKSVFMDDRGYLRYVKRRIKWYKLRKIF